MKRQPQPKSAGLRLMGALLSFLLSLTLPSISVAQSETNSTERASHVTTSPKDEMALSGRENWKAFDGWQDEYSGFKRSRILFNPTDTDELRFMFPENGVMGLGSMDVHVDDEIDKSQLITFQSIPTIQKGFADNTKARDDHLNLFATVRGVAISTLSYLDKTVAAALATTQQQVDQDATHQLLKQISWTSAQIANPDREELFQDINEKFEACMWIMGRNEESTEGTMDTGTLPDYLKHVSLSYCKQSDNECRNAYSREKPETYEQGENQSDYPWAYHYCVCCAERDVSINNSPGFKSELSKSGKTSNSPAENDGWSLADRLFIGTRLPDNLLGIETRRNATVNIISFAQLWRSIYGDYLLVNPLKQADSGMLYDDLMNHIGEGSVPKWKSYKNAMKKEVGSVKSVYIPPYLSVPQWIEVFRERSALQYTNENLYNRINNCSETTTKTGLDYLYLYHAGRSTYYCPTAQEGLKHGICPAVRYILWRFDNGTISDCFDGKAQDDCNEDSLRSLWLEASMGGPLTAADFTNLSGMRATTGASSSSSSFALEIQGTGADQRGDRRDRWITTFCDSSAVTAFKKLHLRMMSITLDFMTYNTKLTRNQKDRVMKLMNRVSSYLELGAMDSITAVRNQLVALHVEGDRRGEAERAAMWSSAIAAQETSQQLGELLTFGGSLDLPSK